VTAGLTPESTDNSLSDDVDYNSDEDDDAIEDQATI
jgi:hypothetical protein